MAPPITSARSVAMATSSACTHMPRVTAPGEVVAAQLGQVPAGGQAQLGRQGLDQHRQQVGHHDDPDQQVAEPGAGGEVGGEVAGVDVRDRGDEGGAEQDQPRPQAAARPDLGSGRRACGGHPRQSCGSPFGVHGAE